jgi:hypothetical protein
LARPTFILAAGLIVCATAGAAEAPVGYGGSQIQLQPIMAPYLATDGVRYEPITIRLTLPSSAMAGGLAVSGNPVERVGCYSVPIIHDRIIVYLYGARLRAEDFTGLRREVLERNLLAVANRVVGRAIYVAASLVGTDAPAMDTRSQTLSAQCH